MTILPPNSSRS